MIEININNTKEYRENGALNQFATQLRYNEGCRTITECLNHYFGCKYESFTMVIYDVDDEYTVWFAQIAKKENGKYISTSSYHWVNVFDENETVLYQNNTDLDRMEGEGKTKSRKYIVFAHEPGVDLWRYKGVYVPCGRDPEMGFIHCRIRVEWGTGGEETNLNLSETNAKASTDYLAEYIRDVCPQNQTKELLAEKFLREFTEKYPREKIRSIPMDAFLFASKEANRGNTFCYRLMYSPLASMGQCHPDIFGIYLRDGKKIVLSKTFQGKFGEDVNAAFDEIKRDIVRLFESADNDLFADIQENPLNSAFKNILLAVYFPEKYFPVPTSTALDAYCDVLGFTFEKKESMAARNRAIVDWKNSVPELADWRGYRLMKFCDWLWRNNRTIDPKKYTKNQGTKRAEEIEKELDDRQLLGEERAAVVKIRVNQGDFRNRLMVRYSKCCLCGVAEPGLLVASHIKPWAASEASEKLDADNGFLMCPNHDKLFDQGYISFGDDGKIMISSELSNVNRVYMNVNEEMRADLTEGNRKFLAYHRDWIFRKDQESYRGTV